MIRIADLQNLKKSLVVYVEDGWKHKRTGAILWVAPVLGYAYWEWQLPSPGKAVAGLAVVAAIMSVREMKAWTKMLWILLLCGFLHVELRAIDADRRTHDEGQATARETENRRFNTTVQGLTTTINGMKTVLGQTTAALTLSQKKH
ncbi:MAG: hypothetical protein ABSB88_04915 [Bryobacteraceae bacterium]|jgi:hypothetical protein